VALQEATYARFYAEALGRLTVIERHLTGAARDPACRAGAVDAVLDEAHSIKGTAAVLGVSALADPAAAIERTLEPVAQGRTPLDATLIETLRATLRQMREVALAAPHGAVVEVTPANGTPHAQGRRTVLHIEDSDVVVDLMHDLLAHRPDVELTSASTARQGLELAGTLRPALIFLDMHLPDGSGEDVLRTILEDPATNAIPVVMVSGDDARGQADRLVAAGAAAYLTKPFSAAAVWELVDRFCQPAAGPSFAT
jgi:CheY-like chemotaxis protein